MMSNKVSTTYGKRFRRHQPRVNVTARSRLQYRVSSSTEIYNIKYVDRSLSGVGIILWPEAAWSIKWRLPVGLEGPGDDQNDHHTEPNTET